MLMRFNPCHGKDNCTQGGTHCEGCGRSHEEIACTRELIEMVADFARKMRYENYQDFIVFGGEKAAKKVGSELEQARTGGVGIPIGAVRQDCLTDPHLYK
jgi:hypothetical protein